MHLQDELVFQHGGRQLVPLFAVVQADDATEFAGALGDGDHGELAVAGRDDRVHHILAGHVLRQQQLEGAVVDAHAGLIARRLLHHRQAAILVDPGGEQVAAALTGVLKDHFLVVDDVQVVAAHVVDHGVGAADGDDRVVHLHLSINIQHTTVGI